MAMAQTAFRTRPAFRRTMTTAANRSRRAEMPLFQAFLCPSSVKVTDGLCIKDATTIDPMCGSGTFLIESAYKALNIAPGLRRNFAAQYWSQIPENVWSDARAEALESIDRQGEFKAFGFDIDDAAVELTKSNARKAGVGSKLVIKQSDVSKFKQPENSITFCNPPYGERMLEIKDAEMLYKKLGDRLNPSKERPCYIITPHEEFERFFGKKADKRRKLYNGMIKCQLYMYFK